VPSCSPSFPEVPRAVACTPSGWDGFVGLDKQSESHYSSLQDAKTVKREQPCFCQYMGHIHTGLSMGHNWIPSTTFVSFMEKHPLLSLLPLPAAGCAQWCECSLEHPGDPCLASWSKLTWTGLLRPYSLPPYLSMAEGEERITIMRRHREPKKIDEHDFPWLTS
jgi:hypothetical protein